MILLFCETCGLRIAEAEITESRAKKVSEFGWICAGCAEKPAPQPETVEAPAVATAAETAELKPESALQRARIAPTRTTGTKSKTATIAPKKTEARPAWHIPAAAAGAVVVLVGLFALSRGSSNSSTEKSSAPAEPVALLQNTKVETKQSAPPNVQPAPPNVQPVKPTPPVPTVQERMREAEKEVENIRDARANSLLKEHQTWFQNNPSNVFEYAERLRDLAGTYRSSPAAREAEKIAAELKIPEVKGRFVRVELSGDNRLLSLAEVQVFSNGTNVAPKGKATQPSVSNDGAPARAIDGTTNGIYNSGSTTHTNPQNNPWWQLELPNETVIQSIVVWNRTDCCQDRLKDFKVSVLDANRQTVWTKSVKGVPPVKSVFTMN